MQSKSLLVAMAAFAVTATGAQAHGTAILERANLTDEQRSALLEARELRQNGELKAARDVLVEAGIDEDVLHELRLAARETRVDIQKAVEAGDYEHFKTLIEDTPLADVITSESDFERFAEAHQLRQVGDFAEAREILDELGIDRPHRGHHVMRGKLARNLSFDQLEALRVATQANDRETVRAILEEAGLSYR